MKKMLFVASMFLFTAVIIAGSAFAGTIKRTAVVMGTDVELTISTDDPALADAAIDAAVGEMSRIESVMSEWLADSPISEINKAAGIKPIKVPDEMFKVISAAIQVSELSGGAFDISWAAMKGMWKFAKGKERVPARAEIKKILPLINYKMIKLDPIEKTVFLEKQGMAIGLGGIAKGYAVDKAMEAIVKLGVKNAILKAGGDMRIQGTDDGKPWEIGIRHPRDRRSLITALPLSNISMSTSGDYERYFIKNKMLYHHIIDPKTGYPARGVQSVSIIAPDTMTTDALSTAVFVLGSAKGLALVEKLKGVEAIIVDANGAVKTSKGISIKK